MIHSLYPVTSVTAVFLNIKKIHLTIKINVLFTYMAKVWEIRHFTHIFYKKYVVCFSKFSSALYSVLTLYKYIGLSIK